jgi:uncharacterized protein (DUF58 family)
VVVLGLEILAYIGAGLALAGVVFSAAWIVLLLRGLRVGRDIMRLLRRRIERNQRLYG